MRINFDFLDLEAFLAVQETGSFHLASEKLGLSQSSITRRIQKLETALDSILFHRTTRAVKPTLAAKRLKARAESILSETKETTRAMRDESSIYAHQLSRSITIATVPTVISGLVAPALRRLRNDHANVRFRILDCAANEVAEAVTQGEADIGICSMPAFEPATTFEFLFEDPMVIAVHSDHHLAAKETVTWSDLSDENLILPSRGTGNRMLIDDALARSGIPLNWAIEVGRTITALQFASAGLGVAPLPKSAVASGQISGVATGPVVSPSIARRIGLLTRKGDVGNELIRQFSDVVWASIKSGLAPHAK